jgi:hypothetical protein
MLEISCRSWGFGGLSEVCSGDRRVVLRWAQCGLVLAKFVVVASGVALRLVRLDHR